MIAPSRRLFVRRGSPTALLAAVLLSSCGGESTSPEVRGSVVVTVTTTGGSPDADGYTIALGSSELTVAASGSAGFDDLSAGTYQVTLGGLAANCSVLGEATRSLTVVEGQEASVSFEVECPFDGAGVALPETVCSALTPVADEGVPLDVIGIGEVPPSFERPILARMSWPEGRQVALALIEDETGTATMMIPLHPSGSLEGGDVTVRISDETQTCPPFSFRILPLPAADGHLAAVVDVMQALLEEEAELFGTSREELLGTPMSELEPPLRLAAIAQALVDGPSDESSLRAIADGTAPDFGPADLDFVERLLAPTGLRAELEAELEEIRAAGLVEARAGARFAGPVLALSPGLALECVTSLEMDAQLLSDCMTLARDKAQGSASHATQNKAIFAMDVAAMLGSRRTAGAFSSLITASQLYDRALADNLPASFVSLDVTPDPAEFREDQRGPGTWAPAMVIATSNGWDLNELLIEVIVGRVTPDVRPTARLTWLQKRIVKWATDPGYSDYRLVEDFFQGLLEIVAGKIGELGVELTDGILMLPPITYGPVDITDTEWSDARIVTGTSVALTPHEEYQPQEPGTSLLEVITALGKFGGTNIATDHIPITVGELSVRIEPDEVLLQPGQDTTFTVTVTDALHPDSVALVPDHPVQGTAELTLGAVNVHTVTYTAPDEPTPNSTDLVGVRHIAQGGARGVSTDPRSASATIRFGGIRLLPVNECVAEGQEVQLDWELIGFDTEPELVWTESAGDVSATGVFKAPEEAGTVTITVAVEGHPNVRDSIEVPVGGCFCSFSVTVAGTTYIGQPGDIAEYFAYETGGTGSPWAIGYINLATPSGASALFAVDIAETVATGPGTYPVPEIGGTLGYGGAPYATYGNDGATMLIHEFEAHTRVTGEIAGGWVHDSSDPDGPPITISATFQVYPPPGTYYGVYSCVVATSPDS